MMTNYWRLYLGLALAATGSVVLYLFFPEPFENKVIAGLTAISASIVVCIMLYGHSLWLWRNVGSLFFIVGMTIFLAWISLGLFGYVDQFDGWEGATARSFLLFGSIFMCIGSRNWVMEERGEQQRDAASRAEGVIEGHAQGVADEKHDQHERELVASDG